MDKINILYKYRFREIYFIRGKEVLNLHWTNIKSFVIHKDYDGYVRPQYVLTLQLDHKTNIWISRHQNDFLVYLDIQKVLTDDMGDQIGPTTQFMKGLFIAINPTSSSVSVDRLQDIDGKPINVVETNDLSEMMVGSPVTIGLIQRDMYNRSMTAANTIVEKDNLQNIVVSMLTRGGFKKALISPFQNYKIYEDIVIPAYPLYKAIQYLDYKYGFHKAGTVIFYDYDIVYMIDTSMKSPVYRSGGSPYTTLNIFESTKNIINGHATGTSARELFVANATTNIVFAEDFTTSGGSTTTVVDINTAEKTPVTYPSSNMNPLESASVTYGTTQAAEYVQQRQLENRVRITISGYHYDIDSFNPNVLTSIYHSNPDIQSRIAGKYRVSTVMCEMHNQGDNFVANTAVSYVYCGK